MGILPDVDRFSWSNYVAAGLQRPMGGNRHQHAGAGRLFASLGRAGVLPDEVAAKRRRDICQIIWPTDERGLEDTDVHGSAKRLSSF